MGIFIYNIFIVVKVKDVLPMDAIYDAVINRIPPPPNQATECVRTVGG